VTHLDLFTGIGGFHLAAEWAGFQPVGFSEIEPYCCRLLAEKWPDIANYGDIRRADFTSLRGRITVCSAGVPCQPASLAGKRRGKNDDRWLWEATLDVVGSVEPAWVIFENPVGILSLGEFGGVLLRLGTLGYEVRAFSVPANAVGAKHRRQRVFIVAHTECQRCDRRADGWGAEVRAGASLEFGGAGQDAEAVADADRAGLEEYESREQRELATVIRSSWPHGFRLTESPLCRAVDGVRDRSYRLKALGNAVVPQQAYPFFAAIAQVEKIRIGEQQGWSAR
jgi:DNA (cytosine-5)-methyltransferase 1